ncbi:MAG: hypothetical protein KAI47_10785 [Deltaproteobacteria bacterium]|nr:hypothetical protein [Deltaproteobacteria bacterium]
MRFSHPGFFEAVNVSFDMMRGFNDVDAAGLMSCKPTGRNGYVSCFRREVLVRASGDPLTEEVLRSGEDAEVLADVIDGDLRYRLGPASTVLQLVFSHLYPIDRVDFAKEYAIRVEPAYTESIQDDDLTRRLSQMKASARLDQIRREGDAAIPRFLVELSSVLNLHLQIWDVPEALEYAYMDKKRRETIENPQRIAQIFAYETGVDLYLRAIQVNEPNLRIFGLLQVIESHYLRYGYEGVLSRLRERIGSRHFDVNDDSQLLEVIAEASSVKGWRDETVDILADILDQHVDRDELERALGDLCEPEVVAELCEPRPLSLFLHDLRDVVGGKRGERRSPVSVEPEEIRSYVPLVQWLTVTIMRGHALDRALATASQAVL